MNKPLLFIISWLIILGITTCKSEKIEAEQALFENLESCKIYWSLLDSTSLAYEMAIKSDSVIIKNAEGVLYDFKIEIDKSLLVKIDPIRFPYWGKGYPFRPCNLPESLRNDSFYYEIEYDFVFYQHLPFPPRIVTFTSWPVRLTRAKVLRRIAK
jgi:hypothetical protein